MTKFNPSRLTGAALVLALLAIFCVLAVPDVLSHLPALAPHAPGLLLAGAFPAFVERKSDDGGNPVTEIADLINAQGASIEQFKARLGEKIQFLEQQLDELALKAARPAGLGGLVGGIDIGAPATAAQRKSLDMGARALIAGDLASAQKHFVEAKAMSASNDPAGGYLVIPQMSNEMTRVMLETSPLLNAVRMVDLGPTDEFEELIDRNDVGVTWVGEQDARNDSEAPTLGKFVVPVHEVYAMPAVTQKLIDSTTFNAMGWLAEKTGEKFGFSFGAAIIGGSGSGQPVGFSTYPVEATPDVSRAWGKLQYLPTGAAGAFKASGSDPTDVLVDTVAALKPQYRAQASWVMSRTTAATLRKIKNGDGDSMWQPATAAGMPPTLMGYPVIEDDQMPAVAADSLSIAFGNFKRGYVFVRRLGIRFLVDPYTAKPKVKLFAYQRVGGAVSNFEAIKMVRFSAT